MRLLLPPLTVAAWNRRPLEAPSRDPPPLPTRVRCRSRVDRIGGGTGVSVGVVVAVMAVVRGRLGLEGEQPTGEQWDSQPNAGARKNASHLLSFPPNEVSVPTRYDARETGRTAVCGERAVGCATAPAWPFRSAELLELSDRNKPRYA